MKKFMFMALAVLAISFASCNNGETSDNATTEDTVEVVDSLTNDTTVVDSAAVGVETPATEEEVAL